MQNAPGLDRRINSGSLKFESELWPGVYFRGDDAMCLAAILRAYIRTLPEGDLGIAAAKRFSIMCQDCQVSQVEA